MKDNESFIFYKSFLEAANEIPDDKTKLETLLTIIHYGLFCEEPKEETSPIAKMAFKFVKPQIDVNLERRKNGQKGGRGHKRETNGLELKNHRFKDEKPMVNSSETNGLEDDNHTFESAKPNVNVNDNDNDNVNVNSSSGSSLNIIGIRDATDEQTTTTTTNIDFKNLIPSLDEIKRFAERRKSKVNPERFYNYNQTRGWTNKNGQVIKDWKSLFKMWEQTERSGSDDLQDLKF